MTLDSETALWLILKNLKKYIINIKIIINI